MIQSYQVNDKFIRTYSDQNYYIQQLHTGNIYITALDGINSNYQYKETDILIPEQNRFQKQTEYEQIIDILSGEGE